jgi:hypothetical protein
MAATVVATSFVVRTRSKLEEMPRRQGLPSSSPDDGRRDKPRWCRRSRNGPKMRLLPSPHADVPALDVVPDGVVEQVVDKLNEQSLVAEHRHWREVLRQGQRLFVGLFGDMGESLTAKLVESYEADAMPGTVGAGGGPDPAGVQCGGPPGPGGGPDPAGTQCGKDPLDGVVVAFPLTAIAVPDPLERSLLTCDGEPADAGAASHGPAARPAPASDKPPTTRRCLRTVVISICPSI